MVGAPARGRSQTSAVVGFSTSGPIDALIRGAWGSWWIESGPVSREDALLTAPVKRGRDVLCSLATLPLVNYRGLDVVPRTFLEQPDPDVPRVVMYAQTIEDLLFDGVSWWLKTGLDYRGFPTSARRVVNVSLHPPDGVRVDAPLPSGLDPRGSSVWVDGVETPADRVIRFDSPGRPLLTTAHRTIRRALLLDALAQMYAQNPRPQETFTDTDDQTVTPYGDKEVEAFLAHYLAGRRQGSPAYIPKALVRSDVAAPSPSELQLVELQRQAALELALDMGLEPEDVGVSTTSRTYFNANDRRTDKINFTFAPYMSAITDRLSMGDITPRGQDVRYDLADYLKPDPVSQAAYWEALVRMRAMGPAEVRAAAGLSGRPPAMGEPATTDPGGVGAVDAGRQTRALPAAGAGAGLARLAPALTAYAAPALTGSFTAGQGAVMRFAVSDFAGARASSTADTATRTITGLAVPYGAVARKYGVGFRFRAGALEYDAEHLNRLRVMDGHTTYIGVHQKVVDSKAGPVVTLKVLDGPEGSPTKMHRDQVLMDAAGGLADGLSIGVDFDLDPEAGDVVWNEHDRTYDVVRATWLETSVTPDPAFTGARVTTVAASMQTGASMDCQHCGRAHPAGISCATFAALSPVAAPPAPAAAAVPAFSAGVANYPPAAPPPPAALPVVPPPAPPVMSADQLTAALAQFAQAQLAAGAIGDPPATATAVNPAALPLPGGAPHGFGPARVSEPAPYRLVFNRKSGEFDMHRGSHDFSTDMISYFVQGDSAAHDRALGFIRAHFNVATTDVDEANPTRQRPDMYVDQRDYETPMWSAVYKGSLADITPFAFPKYNSSSGLVGAHTEGTEPTTGAFTVTNQTITPTAYSGKARINREVWDQGGNPMVSSLIWNQMVRGAREAWEALVVTVLNAGSFTALNTLTAGNADTGQTLSAEITRGLALLQFARGGMRFRTAFTQADLYLALTGALDDGGEPLFPIIGPANRNGQASNLFGTVDVGGMPFVPAWALAAAGQTAATKSYAIDPTAVHAWASPPQRLTLDQVAVAYVDLGVWGYQACAVSDTAGVRTITWDPVA